ncbi:MAG: dTDP-4-dehydrorhamnose 3,5-epimerase [Gallionella sp.]|nr:dTDP-4-dehydrorhamnose 3,5-epimerase [Gallionella sp.]
MRIARAADIEGPLLIVPDFFRDHRGLFFESFHQQKFENATGLSISFVQDNHSISGKNVLRGLHYQIRRPQGKLVEVVSGKIIDVALDIRRSSPTFGKWTSHHLDSTNRHMVWIPPGFAHGFLSLAENSEVIYKTTDYWAPQYERCILWNDPDLAIDWQLNGLTPLLSAKDAAGTPFKQAEVFA